MRHLVLLIVPAAACLAVVIAASGVQRRTQPKAGTVLLTAAAVVAAVAVLLSLLAVALAFLAELPAVAALAGWCRSVLAVDDHVPAGVGLGAVGLLLLSLYRVQREIRRSTWRSDRREPAVIVVDSTAVDAVAVPGRPSRILVSTAILDRLDEPEQRAMLSHERAHIRYGHHRFLVVAGVAAAAVPLLAPVAARVRFCTERWEDEAAASETGDRAVVARAITKAALAGADTVGAPGLALTGIGVAGRVEALLGTERATSPGTIVLFGLGTAGLLASAGASTMQLHHLIGFLQHVCGVA